jgi:hypothetical protein
MNSIKWYLLNMILAVAVVGQLVARTTFSSFITASIQSKDQHTENGIYGKLQETLAKNSRLEAELLALRGSKRQRR